MSRRPLHQWPGAGTRPGPPDHQFMSSHGPRHPPSSSHDGYRDSNPVFMPHGPQPPSHFGENFHGNRHHPGPFHGLMHSGSHRPGEGSPVFSPHGGFSATMSFGGNSVSLNSRDLSPRDSPRGGNRHSPYGSSPRGRSPERSPTRFSGRARGSPYRGSGVNFDDYLDHNGERSGRCGPRGRNGRRTRSPGTILGLSREYGQYDVDDDDDDSSDDDDDDKFDYDYDENRRGQSHFGTRHFSGATSGGRYGGHAAATAFRGSLPAQSLGSGSHDRPGGREGRNGTDRFAAQGAFGSSRDSSRQYRSGRY